MKRFSFLTLIFLVGSVLLSSCSHGISIQEAASGGKAKCGRNYLK